MAKLIVPKHTADLELIIPAIQVYYDDGGWVSMSDYKDRLFQLLKASGKETTRNTDETHYTKCSEIPRYFGWLERKKPGNKNSDVRITESGKQFYENYIAKKFSEIHELIINSLETVSFGRNNEGCGSDCDIEAPNIIIVASIVLGGITFGEAACILEDTVYNKVSVSNAMLNIQMCRNNGIKPEPKRFHKDIKPIGFLRKLGFFVDDKYNINISKDVAELYMQRLIKLPITRSSDDKIKLDMDSAALYTKTHFLEEVYISEKQYDVISKLLKKKKNIVIQGAPGVGKTFAATRLVYSLLGKKDNARVKLVQFHQSYTFEDFVVGYKPTADGFDLEYGPFYSFCEDARIDPDNDYYFIIDEINRGNLSRIFGELLMLIENTKRDKSVTLLYTKEPFSVPHNVYIIGLMNTADRSLAMIDYALRRRFAFYTMETALDKPEFNKQIELINNSKVAKLIEELNNLNKEIEHTDTLGKGFQIGHSYLCIEDAEDEDLRDVVKYEIIPLLEEYWYDEPSIIDKWSKKLLAALN